MAFGEKALEALFEKVTTLRIGVIGDFSLDIYWHADMTKSELSRETPHFALPVVRERMQPGGAGNVACNFAAFQPAQVTALSVLGHDWRSTSLIALLAKQNISTGFLQQTRERVTNAYIKPMRQGISDTVYEDPRLDFENHEPLGAAWEEVLLDMLGQAVPSLDVLYVCDQMRHGCITPKVRQRIIELGAEGMAIWVDSRERIGLFHHVIAKPNEVELFHAMDAQLPSQEEKLLELAFGLQEITQGPLLVTRGESGCLALESGQAHWVPAYPVKPPLDICGAGDTFGSTAALLYAAGADLKEVAAYASCSASLTVQKLAMTGMTTRNELLERVTEAERQGFFPIWHN